MTRRPRNPWLYRYAVLTALASWVLICFGGLVTSHGAGLAVPDWPNTYGYNLFLFPISKWVGGIFYEHTHRLVASAVGLMTVLLAIALWRSPGDPLLRRLGLVAVVAVIAQGVLGGLRVVLLVDQLGIVHATLGQLFLVLVSAIALRLSPWWQNRVLTGMQPGVARLTAPLALLSALVLLQLVVGASMRHRHAGLAIPDFPTAHGQWYPSTDPASIQRYNLSRTEVRATNPIEAWDVHLQMSHRALALVILAAAASVWNRSRRYLPADHWITRGARWLTGLILVQAGLGAFTIWSGKAADVATAHVAVGSAVLAGSSLMALAAFATRAFQSRGLAGQPGRPEAPASAGPGALIPTPEPNHS